MLISDSHQQKPPFGTVYCHLPYYLIKRLTKQFLPNWTDTLGPGLSMFECLLQILFQLEHIISGWLWMTHILHEEFLFWSFPVSWRDHVVQYILRTRICVYFFSRMFGLLVLINILWNLDLGFVINQWERDLVDVLALCLWHWFDFEVILFFTLLNVIIIVLLFEFINFDQKEIGFSRANRIKCALMVTKMRKDLISSRW